MAQGSANEWDGKDGNIAAWQDDSWVFFMPQASWKSWISEEQKTVVFDGTQWTTIETDINPVNMVGVNTTADATNRLSAKSDSILFSHDDITPGSGDIRQLLNKSNASNFASQLYQTNYSGRAETGLTGSDNFQFNVSPDGNNSRQAILIDKDEGSVSMPNSTIPGYWQPSRGDASLLGVCSHQLGQELGISTMSPVWMMIFPLVIGSSCAIERMTFRVHVAGADQIGLALYNSAHDNTPGDLISDFGAADCSTSGLKTQTLETPLNLSPGLYWIGALTSQGTATTRGGPYPRDIGNSAIRANIIRAGVPLILNTTTHSIPFWNPPATLGNLETRPGQLDPVGQHCPAIFVR